MRFISVFFVFTIFLLSPFETEGQSLFKDSKTLVQRVDDIRQTNLQRSLVMNTLQQIRRDSSLFDSLQTLIRLDTLRKDSILLTRAMVSHSSQILAILDHYRDWADEESEFLERIEKLNEVFGSDKDLGGILRTVKLDSLLNTHLELLRESFYNYQDTLRSARQREKILRLLHAEESVSPLEYISIARTLEDYQTPPLPMVKFAEASAEGSNKNVANGIVNQQALIIGMFTFLVERAQQEVVITFLNRLLGENGIQQFREVFPKTSLAFKDLNFTYSESFLERLRQSFYEDVQLLSVSLPSLLTNPDYFQLLENDPIAYNFLQLYTMMAMGQQDLPISEIIPLTYRNLFDRYEDEKKAVNLKIAKEYHTYTEYQSLSGKIQEILQKLVDVTTVLDSFQDLTRKNFEKLNMDRFAVTLTYVEAPSVTGGEDSIPPQPSTQLEEIDITGIFEAKTKESIDTVYKFLTKTDPTTKKVPIDVNFTLGTFSPNDLSTLNYSNKQGLVFENAANLKMLSGKVPKTQEAAFLKLVTPVAPAPNAKVIEELNVMVLLDGHDSMDEYLNQLLAAQPSLRAVKFIFGFDEEPNYYILGTLQKIVEGGIIAIASSPSTDIIPNAKAINFLVSSIGQLPVQISPLPYTLDEGKIIMGGKIDSLAFDQQALLDLQKLSEKWLFPADTIPVLAQGYEGLLPILNGDENYSLKMLPSLLKAEFDPIIAGSWSTLKTYDKFLRNPLSDQQLRAAGLALTRDLNGPWYEDMTIVEMLHQWQADMIDYRNELKRWKAILFPEDQLREDSAAYETAKQGLIELIDTTESYYQRKSRNETFAFQVLRKILEDELFDGETVDKDRDENNLIDREWITKGELEIAEVEERLFELNRELAAKSPGKRRKSPVRRYLEKKNQLDALQKAPYQIDDLEFLLRDLQLLLDKLDRRTASMETKALKSISPIVQITEALSHLMYAIKDDSSSTGWIRNDTLNIALLDPELSPVFVGLLGQQLKQIKTKGNFSIPGLTNFVKLTIQDLDFITAEAITVDSINLGFFKKAAFVNLTLNRLLELPLFIDQERPDRTFSIIDKFPDLSPIPDLSDQALDFIYYANVKDHRHAMSSVIRLFTQISEVVQERRTRETIKLNEEIKQLMADKVMAEAGVKRITEELVEEGGENQDIDKQDIGKQEAPPISDEPRDTSAINRLTAMKKLTEAEVKRTATLLAEKEAERVRKMKKKEKRMAKRSKSPDVLAFLRDYGDFMADLIDADTSTDVNALLKAFADPPGSSQEKRRNYITANLNGYVGVLAGYERLSGGLLRENQEYATFAPTIPVGISFSKMSGKGKKAQSYSLFLSILDLGSLTTYSLDGNVAGESQISFKNVLKPGLQFHWNIKNSPFFLGAGGQLGPQFREFDGKQSQLNSAHFFINFGVDVVIKRLFKLENKPRQKDRIKKKKAS